MKKLLALVLVILICVSSVWEPFNVNSAETISNHIWQMFHYNRQRTGQSPYDTSTNSGTLKWKYKTGDVVLSSPAIASDGTIYVGSYDKFLYAINPNGTLKWRYTTGDKIYSSPAIASDGTIYVGSLDNYLYAINPNGTFKWRFKTGDSISSSPAVGSNGIIYVGSHDNYLYAINTNGTMKWKYKTGHAVESSPAIASDGAIYVGSDDKYLHAISPDGTSRWKFQTYDYVFSSPSIAPDGTIYIATFFHYIYALNPDGSLKWKYDTNSYINSSPAVASDGTIYIGCNDYYLRAIKSDGTLKWKYKTGSPISSSPAISSNGTIYIGSKDNYLYAINPDGTLKWKYKTDSDILSSPAINTDGTVYIGSSDSYLHAIGHFTITASAGTGGSITPSGKVAVIRGANKSFTISANIGYKLKDVKVDGASVGISSTFLFTNVTEDHTIEAVFEPLKFTIKATALSGGAIGFNRDTTVYTLNYGDSIRLSINPDPGYRIKDVKVDGASVGAVSTYTFTNITANHTIEASFELNNCNVRFDTQGGSPQPADQTVRYGGKVTKPQDPAKSGYNFAGWYTDNTTYSQKWDFATDVVKSNTTLYAKWTALNIYTIDASASSGGTINPSGSVTVTHGDNKTFTISPNTGYKISDVKVDGASVGAVSSYTFTNIKANHTIEASFESIKFSITVSYGSNGTITPSGTIIVNYGDSKTFTITPNAGYKISNVKVDGVSQGAIPSYTFSSVTSNHTIEALFEKAQDQTIIVLQIDNPYMTVNGVRKEIDPGRGTKPIIKNSRTLLPIRSIVEELGGSIAWDGTERKVTISFKGTTIELWIDKPTALVNGSSVKIDQNNIEVVPEIINSRTMLPLRFVAESLGCDVQWEGSTKTITVTYPKP